MVAFKVPFLNSQRDGQEGGEPVEKDWAAILSDCLSTIKRMMDEVIADATRSVPDSATAAYALVELDKLLKQYQRPLPDLIRQRLEEDLEKIKRGERVEERGPSVAKWFAALYGISKLPEDALRTRQIANRLLSPYARAVAFLELGGQTKDARDFQQVREALEKMKPPTDVAEELKVDVFVRLACMTKDSEDVDTAFRNIPTDGRSPEQVVPWLCDLAKVSNRRYYLDVAAVVADRNLSLKVMVATVRTEIASAVS